VWTATTTVCSTWSATDAWLPGAASHGTHEFHAKRARITKRRIEEKGFNAVAVEADWPDAYRVKRCALAPSADADATAALAETTRLGPLPGSRVLRP